MAGAYVQSWESVPTSNSNTSVQVDVNTTGATPGNLLIGAVSFRYNSGTGMTGLSDATGNWTEISEAYSALSDGAAWYYRVADGTTADNLDVDIDGDGIGYIAAQVAEFSGLDSTPTMQDDDIGARSTGTTVNCGTATPTTSNGTAIAFLAVRRCQDWSTDLEGAGIAIGSSYTIHHHASSGSSGRPIASIASINYTSTAAQSPTWSSGVTAGATYGAVAVFKEIGETPLLADDVESASEVSSPAVGQAHALNADGVESASGVSAPDVGQVHALTAEDVESATEVSNPVVTSDTISMLLAEDIESASQVSAPLLTHHSYAVVTWANMAVYPPTIVTLSAEDIEAQSEVSSPALSIVYTLTANSIESVSAVSLPKLVSWAEVDDTQSTTWIEVET